MVGDESQGNHHTAAKNPDPCRPLSREVEILEEQIDVLEEGLPRAPGMERAALYKEINEYRETLDARRRALRQCRGGSE
jgi:hypothetical protein